jgi:hypothetical protein
MHCTRIDDQQICERGTEPLWALDTFQGDKEIIYLNLLVDIEKVCINNNEAS